MFSLLTGLDDSIYPYAHSFLNNNVTGRGLLNITVDDLYKLQVEKVGHQEIILEALEHLRNLHHNLDSENLQVCWPHMHFLFVFALFLKSLNGGESKSTAEKQIFGSLIASVCM